MSIRPTGVVSRVHLMSMILTPTSRGLKCMLTDDLNQVPEGNKFSSRREWWSSVQMEHVHWAAYGAWDKGVTWIQYKPASIPHPHVHWFTFRWKQVLKDSQDQITKSLNNTPWQKVKIGAGKKVHKATAGLRLFGTSLGHAFWGAHFLCSEAEHTASASPPLAFPRLQKPAKGRSTMLTVQADGMGIGAFELRHSWARADWA